MSDFRAHAFWAHNFRAPPNAIKSARIISAYYSYVCKRNVVWCLMNISSWNNSCFLSFDFLPIEKPEFWLPLAYVNGDVRLLRTSATYFLQWKEVTVDRRERSSKVHGKERDYFFVLSRTFLLYRVTRVHQYVD